MSKSPWGGIGAWAAEAERAEAEEREAAANASAAGGGGGGESFPSLKEAVSTTSKQKKKTKMSLQEFTKQESFGSSATATRLTPEEMMRLPTGPKERTGEEMYQGRLGGGFSNYGTRTGGGPPGRIRDRDQDSEGSWAGGARRGYGGFEDDRRRGPPPSRVSEFEQMPSRADEVDNWVSMKRSQPALDSGGPARTSRYASLGGGPSGFSRADEVDNWTATKKPLPPPPATAPSRSSSFVSGFRSEMRPGPELERWTKEGNNQEPQSLVLEQPVVKVNKPNPFGAARPREEVLAEKGVDWKKVDMEIEGKKAAATSRPTSSQSSRPGSSQSGRSEGAALQQQQGIGEVPVKPKPKVNPFGDAKPREVLLQEKGLDWRKIDFELEHRRIDRPETEEEKNLKEEIEHLTKESLEKSGEEQANLSNVIVQKEKDLELLIRELDDKVRFGQKAVERPGSGAGRYTGPPVRAASQPGAYEEPRGSESMDRPRSRGSVEPWTRLNDDRRGYSGGRDRGFSGSRDFDRSRSKERW